MSWTLEGNKTGSCGCVCLESGVRGRAGWTGALGDRVEPREVLLLAALGLPLASVLGPRAPWMGQSEHHSHVAWVGPRPGALPCFGKVGWGIRRQGRITSVAPL